MRHLGPEDVWGVGWHCPLMVPNGSPNFSRTASPSDHSHTPGCRVHKISSEPAGCSQSCQQVQNYSLGSNIPKAIVHSQLPEPPTILPGAARAPCNPLPPSQAPGPDPDIWSKVLGTQTRVMMCRSQSGESHLGLSQQTVP